MIRNKLKNDIISMYKDSDYSVMEIATLCNTSTATIVKVLRENNISLRQSQEKKPTYQKVGTKNYFVKLTNEVMENIAIDYYEKDMTMREIIAKYNISWGSMQKVRKIYTKKYGVKSRNGHKRKYPKNREVNQYEIKQ